MARILIFGGHGRIALLTHPLLVARGDEVTAVIRNPDHTAEVEATGAAVAVVDIESAGVAELTDLIRGFDAVVWSAGAGGGDPQRTIAVDQDAAIRTMDAAVAAGVDRYVIVSYFGARPDHGVPPEDSFFTYAEAKAKADEHLRSTSLAYTVLAPSSLTFDESTGLIDTAASESGEVARADVAAVIAATLADDTTVRRTIAFNAGSVPIAQAIAG